jgi:hypothetical protein
MRGDAYRKIMPIVERAAFGPTSFGQPPSDKYSGSARKRDSERELRANQRAEILRMVNSGKTSAAAAARLFGLHRSSVSRLMSQARAEGAPIGKSAERAVCVIPASPIGKESPQSLAQPSRCFLVIPGHQ